MSASDAIPSSMGFRVPRENVAALAAKAEELIDAKRKLEARLHAALARITELEAELADAKVTCYRPHMEFK